MYWRNIKRCIQIKFSAIKTNEGPTVVAYSRRLSCKVQNRCANFSLRVNADWKWKITCLPIARRHSGIKSDHCCLTSSCAHQRSGSVSFGLT